MPAKYSTKQLEEVKLLGMQNRYYGARFLEHIKHRNPLFLYDVARILWVSLMFRIKFKDAYLEAKFTYRPKKVC